ncbi:hypothetical protein B0H17DRAFT_1211953 [Mycena rosella]|uniref:Uncharacterized protein n=1 Tax=Mycena rosella TaxID=1033263 RepID=A0AAD7CTP7_MYCRO|nr:hypothetical protein B0H17DRAFT_1211953 [Mycena rosella]
MLRGIDTFDVPASSAQPKRASAFSSHRISGFYPTPDAGLHVCDNTNTNVTYHRLQAAPIPRIARPVRPLQVDVRQTAPLCRLLRSAGCLLGLGKPSEKEVRERERPRIREAERGAPSAAERLILHESASPSEYADNDNSFATPPNSSPSVYGGTACPRTRYERHFSASTLPSSFLRSSSSHGTGANDKLQLARTPSRLGADGSLAARLSICFAHLVGSTSDLSHTCSVLPPVGGTPAWVSVTSQSGSSYSSVFSAGSTSAHSHSHSHSAISIHSYFSVLHTYSSTATSTSTSSSGGMKRSGGPCPHSGMKG